MSTRISSRRELSAVSKFQEGFFSIFNEEAFQEFRNISSDFWWKNSAQGRSLSFSLRRGSCHCVICCWAFFPLKVFLSHWKKWPTPHHFTLTAVLGNKNQSNFGMEKNVKLPQRMLFVLLHGVSEHLDQKVVLRCVIKGEFWWFKFSDYSKEYELQVECVCIWWKTQPWPTLWRDFKRTQRHSEITQGNYSKISSRKLQSSESPSWVNLSNTALVKTAVLIPELLS